MPRDSRRQRLYDAEDFIDVRSPRLPNADAVQAFIDKVMTSAFVQSRWGQISIRYEQTHGGNGRYRPWERVIRTGKNPTQQLILHEIGHALTPGEYADHGPEYAAVLLTLVGRFGEPGHAPMLRDAYREHRVKYRGGMRVIPAAGSHTVVTKGQRLAEAAARRRAVTMRPVTRVARRDAATTLRRMVAQGEFGPPGRKARINALAVARKLEQD